VIHPLDVDDAEHPEQLLGPITAGLRRDGTTPEVAMLRSSFTAGALVDYAESLPASLIAVASHVRSGLARLALGSVSMGVVSLARCPVLVERVD
jgi:nucleotide-binding universal stress UspA family protein